jgi:hypothetical protein
VGSWSITTLAAARPSLWLWLGVLLLVAVLGGLGAMALRRRLLRDDAGSAPLGLMQELEQLRLTGKISAEEYGRAKRRLAERAAGRAPEAPAKPHGLNGPQVRADGTLVARPGHDLAGDPLPPPDGVDSGPNTHPTDPPPRS